MLRSIRAITVPTLQTVPKLCASSSTKFEKKATQRFKVKEVPKDIWAEANDPRFTNTEVVEGRWQWVERLLPRLRVPVPSSGTQSAAGWKMPKEDLGEGPYHVLRTRNHMLPVYHRPVTKEKVLVTRVGKVQGDIYLFEADGKAYLESRGIEKVQSQVNEIGQFVNFKGNYVETLKEWLYQKGF